MSSYQGNIIIKNPATPTGPRANGSAPGIWSMNEVAYWIKQGVWPDPNIISDIYFPYVSLLLSTSSLSNANNNLFVDSSGAFNPISRNGNTTQGSFTPYSTNWSNYFPGSVGNYLTAPNNAAFQFGTGDVTIESWIYITGDSVASPDGNRHATICAGIGPTGISNDFWFYVKGNSTTTGTGLILRTYNSSSEVAVFNTTYSFSKNTWYHIALSRSGNNMYLFIDGALHASTTYTGAITVGSNPLNIGYAQTGGINYNAPFFGYLSNLRIVKGTAVYTSAFTPPTAPLTAISGTSILTCQSNRFRDASSNNFAITLTGSINVTDYGPFSPTYPGISYNQSDITNWSGYFDGSADYLTAPTSTAFAFGTGDFTIEGWLYYQPTGDLQLFADFRPSVTDGAYPALYIDTSGNMVYYVSTGARITSGSMTANTWNHFALARSGTSTKLFINGVQSGSTYSDSNNYLAGALRPVIGSSGYNIGTLPFKGYLSNLRIVKGTAVYTSTFTPPTSPLTAISGTSLLTLQNAAFTDNSTNNFALTQFGNTTVTGNSPFQATGLWSVNFPGSGSYLTMANSTPFNLSGGTYTIEMWINPVGDYGNYNTLVAKRVLNSGTTAWEVYLRIGSGVLSFYNGTNYESSTTPTPGIWSHVAAVYDGTNINLYLNGTRVLQSAMSNNDVTANIQIGTFSSYDERFIGNMSNLRITKGAALYSGSSFTPPTGPLTTTVSSGTVSLLTCQSNRFVDNSVNAATITVVGSPSVQTFNPFYTSTIASNGGSMYFDGNDYLSYSQPAIPGNFTLEHWFYLTSTSNEPYMFGNQLSGIQTEVKNGNIMVYYPSGFLISTTGVNVTPNQWYHVAVVRNGSTTTLYLNGINVGSTTTSYTMSAATFYIGTASTAVGNSAYSTNGYITDCRIVTSAVYTSNFTPPTAPLTPNPNTVFLLNGMNAGIYDATAINDMETVGNAQVSTVQSKFGGSSMYFDGSGDYLITRSNPDLYAFGSGDFTIEFWLYLNSTAGLQIFYDGRPASTPSTTCPTIYMNTQTLLYYANGANRITGATLSTGTWYHIALSRSGTSTKMFLNGTQTGSTYTDSTVYTNSAARPMIGNDGNDVAVNGTNGYIDDLRVTKGIARYTSNFTPPTTAFPIY